MKNILLIIFTVLFSFFLESQIKHTGKIVKMTEKEITVKSDNINKLF